MPADPTRSHAPAATGPLSTAASAGSDPSATTGQFEAWLGGDAPGGPPGFDLHEEVGRGGMGVVYRATDRAFGRGVAVKLLRDDYPPRGPAARRFLEEAKITGQLQHPGVPAAYHVGELADGRPFLAMKLIRGDTLAALQKSGADRGRLLAAFEGVCQAVAYAHSRGVIHRDLKPANVMVGAFGEVQVMDWGLAKVLDVSHEAKPSEDDPDATSDHGTAVRSQRGAGDATRAGSVLGTPAYMAPEQAIGAVDQLDRRTDVFGLGAVLCALLTGQPPFVGADAESTRQLAARGKTADALLRLDACGAEPDLIALGKRCLAVEPADRPADAGAVAEAVAALRRAADDRARRAEVDRGRAEVRRRLQLRLGGLAAAVLLVGLAGTGYGLWRADAARRRAEVSELATADQLRETESARQREADQRAAAEERTRFATEIKDFLERDVLQLADPGTQAADGKLKYDADVRLRDVLLRASKAIDGRFAGQPAAEAELRGTLGYTLMGMGRADLAVGHYERVRTLLTGLRGSDHPVTQQSLNNLAVCYDALGRHADAVRLAEECLAARRRVLPADHPETLRSLSNLAVCYAKVSRHADALRVGEECLAAQRRVLPADHPDILGSMQNLAASYSDLGRHADALRVGEECLALCRRTLPADHPDALKSLGGLAHFYAALGRHADAVRVGEECLAAQRRVLPADHPDILESLHGLAASHFDLGRCADAVRVGEECLAAQRRVLPADHNFTIASLQNLAACYTALGRHADALRLCEECLASRRRTLPADHPLTLASLTGLGASYRQLKREADARPLLEEAFSEKLRVLPANHRWLAVAAAHLAGCYAALGRGADATATADRYLRHVHGKQHVAPEWVSNLLIERNRHPQAMGDAAGCRATAELAERFQPATADDQYNAACLRAIAAGLYAKANQPAEAAADADRAMGWLTKAVAAGYRDRKHMEQDADLAPLRGRADFRKLLNTLPEPAPPPRPVR